MWQAESMTMDTTRLPQRGDVGCGIPKYVQWPLSCLDGLAGAGQKSEWIGKPTRVLVPNGHGSVDAAGRSNTEISQEQRESWLQSWTESSDALNAHVTTTQSWSCCFSGAEARVHGASLGVIHLVQTAGTGPSAQNHILLSVKQSSLCL